MSIVLLIILILVDVVLIGAVYFLGKNQFDPSGLVQELNEERQMLKEMRSALKEEIESAQARNQATLDQVSGIAAEVEMEIKTNSGSIDLEMKKIVAEIEESIEDPLRKLTRKQSSIEKMLRTLNLEKKSLQTTLNRAEKLSKFFSNSLPYEEVLEEIEDKKYVDAKHMITQGMPRNRIAEELGLSETEVDLIASMG